MTTNKKSIILFLGMLLSTSSFAELIVNKSIIIYDDPLISKNDVTVFNTDEESNLYLKVEPFKVIHPGAEEQQLIEMPLDADPEFLASPNRVIIAPQGRSIVRMLNLNSDGREELVYRVNLIPVTPPVELEDNGVADIESRLEIVIAYQVLVIVLPRNPQPNVVASRTGTQAVFANDGNANYLLTDGEQCDPGNPDVCELLEDRRIYPGNSWSLALPFDGPFSYKVKTHDGLVARVYE